jgi:hypothetical protein
VAYRVFWVQDDLAFLRECQTASCMAGYDVEAFDNSMTTLHQAEWVLNVLTCYAPGLGSLRAAEVCGAGEHGNADSPWHRKDRDRSAGSGPFCR